MLNDKKPISLLVNASMQYTHTLLILINLAAILAGCLDSSCNHRHALNHKWERYERRYERGTLWGDRARGRRSSLDLLSAAATCTIARRLWVRLRWSYTRPIEQNVQNVFLFRICNYECFWNGAILSFIFFICLRPKRYGGSVFNLIFSQLNLYFFRKKTEHHYLFSKITVNRESKRFSQVPQWLFQKW